MDIRAMIVAGESGTLEFKASFGKDVIVSLAAFANTKGGKVVAGVDNKGRAVGIDVGPETRQRYLNEIKVSTYPQIIPRIECYKIKGKNILVFEITEYSIKPVAYKNRYYKRIGNSNHVLNLDEIVDLQRDRVYTGSGAARKVFRFDAEHRGDGGFLNRWGCGYPDKNPYKDPHKDPYKRDGALDRS